MSHDPLQNPKKRMTANILEMNGRIQKRRPTGDMEELTSASWPSVLVRGPPPWWGPAPPPCPAPSSGWRFSLEEGGGPVSYSITCGGRQRAGVSALTFGLRGRHESQTNPLLQFLLGLPTGLSSELLLLFLGQVNAQRYCLIRVHWGEEPHVGNTFQNIVTNTH